MKTIWPVDSDGCYTGLLLFRLPVNIPAWWEGHKIRYKRYETPESGEYGRPTVMLCERDGGYGEGDGVEPDPLCDPPVQPWDIVTLARPGTEEALRVRVVSVDVVIPGVDWEGGEYLDAEDPEAVAYWVIEAELQWKEGQ